MIGGQRRGHGGRPYTAAARMVRHHSAEWRQLNGELPEVQEGTMRRNTSVQHKMSRYVCSVLMLLTALATIPTDTLAGEAKVQRLIFVSAGFNESNRFWTI